MHVQAQPRLCAGHVGWLGSCKLQLLVQQPDRQAGTRLRQLQLSGRPPDQGCTVDGGQLHAQAGGQARAAAQECQRGVAQRDLRPASSGRCVARAGM